MRAGTNKGWMVGWEGGRASGLALEQLIDVIREHIDMPLTQGILHQHVDGIEAHSLSHTPWRPPGLHNVGTSEQSYFSSRKSGEHLTDVTAVNRKV